MEESFKIRFTAIISSIETTSSPTAISRPITLPLAASAIRILNDISIYRRTVALKPTIVIIRST